MDEELYEAYDNNAGMWLPHPVPAAWFDTFPHLCKEGPHGADPADVPPAKSIEDMTVHELQAYAAAEQIDLGEATKKADVLETVRAAVAGRGA